LSQTNIPETDKSLDPLLVSKPNQTHNSTDTVETQRVIHTSLLQTGKGKTEIEIEKSDIYSSISDDSSSDSSVDDTEPVKVFPATALKRKPDIKEIESSDKAKIDEPKKKKFKEFSFSIDSD